MRGPRRDTNVQSRNPQNRRDEFSPFFFPFFPCFQIAASPLPAHGYAHARRVLAGEGSGTRCHTATVLARSPRPGDPFCQPSHPSKLSSLSQPPRHSTQEDFEANWLAVGGNYSLGLWGRGPQAGGANAPGLRGSTSKIQLFHGKVVGHSHTSTAAHC